MDGRPLRIMFRFSTGLPWRQASAEERARFSSLFTEIFTRWKSSGVKLLGYFGSRGQGIDGFSHNLIFAVDDLSVIDEMDADIISGEIGRYVEKFSFDVGWGLASFEGIWDE